LGTLERALAIRGPDIRCVAEGLFCPIVEVVPERPNLRLELDDRDEMAFDDGDQIPILGRSEEPRQLTATSIVDRVVRNAA
jgi:hypothetical protein